MNPAHSPVASRPPVASRSPVASRHPSRSLVTALLLAVFAPALAPTIAYADAPSTAPAPDPTAPAANAAPLPGLAESPEHRDARMAWWRAARFGMFIHWGVYSVPAGRWNGKPVKSIGEWIMNTAKIPMADYQKLPAQFDPEKFNADDWVQVAKNAGQKYIVITAKHHDGFAMFDSKASSFNIVDDTPFKRDPIKELAAACKKAGIKFGLYYSQDQDWNHPGGGAYGGHWDKAQDGSFDDYLKSIAVPQIKEILTNYGPISVLWFDTPKDMTPERTALITPLLKLQPDIVVNNRLGEGFAGDTETPEQHIPATGFPGRDWETCMTINGTWGYKSDDKNFKSVEVLLHNLIDIASKGGNYLLNVGPTSEGVIPQPEIDRLAAMGQWLKVNGDAIYGTSASPFRHSPLDGRFTVKGNRLFVHVFHWPKDGDKFAPLQIIGLSTPVQSATYLATAAPADYTVANDAQGLPVVSIKPPAALDPIATVIALNLSGPPVADARANAIWPDENGQISLPAADAVLSGQNVKLIAKHSHLGNFVDTSDAASWTFGTTAPADYTVSLNYAVADDAAGSEFTVAADAQTLPGRLGGTGGADKYKSVPFGTLHLPPGAHTLALHITEVISGQAMNLRQIDLTPAK